MTSAFSILPTPWIVPREGPAETKNTTAWMRIVVGDRIVTRVDDRWSQSARDQVVLSAYPLALWFASSWWRLLWEPAPVFALGPSPAWRMAHETAAVGHGFVWPRLRFVSDGETVEISSWASPHSESEPIRYLENVRAVLPVKQVEGVIEQFQALVLRRLQVTGPRVSDLGALWDEVQVERANPEKAAWRRIEARLGYDPDEAPEALVGEIRTFGEAVGQSSSEEIATVCGGRPDPGEVFSRILDSGRSDGVRGKFPALPTLRVEERQPPWQRGRQLAAQVRKALSLGEDIVTNETIANLLGVSSKYVKDDRPDKSFKSLPMGLAIREANSQIRVILRKRHPEARRFEAARLFADGLVAPESERWLPATDATTARQKVQRSFAAEFLAPISALGDRLQGDFSEEGIEDAAVAFGVSPLLVRSHLANNGLISPEAVESPDRRFAG